MNFPIDQETVYVFTTRTGDSELVDYLKDDFNFEVTARKLNLKQQAHLQLIRSTDLKIKKLVTQLFTKYILNYFLGQLDPWQDIQFECNQYGKPKLPNLEFNQSSSNDLISMAVSLKTPIGIDLSHNKQDSIDPNQILDQFYDIYHPIEMKILLQENDVNIRYTKFNQLWTLKEAFTKLIGSGLNIDLKRVGFAFEQNVKLQDCINDCEFMNEYEVAWEKEIPIIIENDLLQHELVNDKPYYCLSGCLETTQPPILISLVHQNSNLQVKNYHLNFINAITI